MWLKYNIHGDWRIYLMCRINVAEKMQNIKNDKKYSKNRKIKI